MVNRLVTLKDVPSRATEICLLCDKKSAQTNFRVFDKSTFEGWSGFSLHPVSELHVAETHRTAMHELWFSISVNKRTFKSGPMQLFSGGSNDSKYNLPVLYSPSVRPCHMVTSVRDEKVESTQTTRAVGASPD